MNTILNLLGLALGVVIALWIISLFLVVLPALAILILKVAVGVVALYALSNIVTGRPIFEPWR